MYRLFYFILFGLFTGLYNCGDTATDCNNLTGSWSNGEGQEWVFSADGRALLISRFGSKSDTDQCVCQTNCQKRPAVLDIKDCKTGPFMGKSIYCIFEFTSDSTMRLRYEPGNQADARPTSFDPEQTVKFVKKRL